MRTDMSNTLSVDTDYKSYTEVYTDYYPLIFSSIYSKINNYDAAEDICQEVFLRLFNKFDQVKEARKWLYGAMRLVMFEHFRKKGMADEDIESNLNDASLSYVNGFKESRIVIEEALDSLQNYEDEKEKTLFELISIYNYTYKKAGEMLGYSFDQVRYRYKKISESLLGYLKDRGIENLEALI